MEFKFKLVDGAGQHEAAIGMDLYKSEKGFVGELNSRFPVAAGMPTAAEQLFAQSGFYRSNDPANGIRSARIRDIMDGMDGISAAVTSPGGVGISRFVMPAALLSGIQNDIYEDKSGVMGQFKKLVALTQTISGNRYERPIFNYDLARASRSKPIAQLSEPTAMGLLTIGETSGTIPIESFGLEVSDPAMDYFGFAEIQKCMSIMATEQMAEKADGWLISMLNGDADHGMAALPVVKANTFDSSIVAAGVITQKAFMKWIATHSKRAPITHVICDVDTAMALEGRANRPDVQGDNPTSNRIDTVESIMNDMWPSTLPVFLVTNPSFPANTLVGISQPNAMIMYESTTAAYNSVEQFVTRRSTKFRVDQGGVALRFYDRAWHVLSLTI